MDAVIELHGRVVELHGRHVELDGGFIELDEFANSHGQVILSEKAANRTSVTDKPQSNELKWESTHPLSSHDGRNRPGSVRNRKET